jgi:UDP-N-acetylmuramate--alanine ligase
VTGSDLRENEYTKRLATKGAKIFVGHAAEQVAQADVVVF